MRDDKRSAVVVECERLEKLVNLYMKNGRRRCIKLELEAILRFDFWGGSSCTYMTTLPLVVLMVGLVIGVRSGEMGHVQSMQICRDTRGGHEGG
jgi:hypothetical protein